MSKYKCISNEQIEHFYQPIYNLCNWSIMGHEALLRLNDFPASEVFFKEAKKQKKLSEMDSRSIHKALLAYQAAGLFKNNNKLFLNIFPTTILCPKIRAFLNTIIKENNLDAQKIVLEILESEIIDDFESFKNQLSKIRKMGFQIAIDDIGSGYSSIKSVIELEPDYLKLDRYFAQNIHQSKQKQSLVSFLLNYCKHKWLPVNIGRS